MRITYLFGILTVAVLAICGCATSMSSITKHGDKYDGKKVVVNGRVINTLHLDDLNYFVLKSGNSKVNVITNDFLPVLNDKVRVKGKVINKFYYQRDTIQVIQESVKPKDGKNIFNRSVN